MTQRERLYFLLRYLIHEKSFQDTEIPLGLTDQKSFLRSLLNIRPPQDAAADFLRVQDAYLREEIQGKGITDLKNLKPVQENFYLWQGDITALKADAIVNAANDRMLGCFLPCHGCIDNAIHSFAGIQLRLACNTLMKKQKFPEPTGTAKITPGYNLPAKYVLHTVGPIIKGDLTRRDCEQLAACYRSCLELAEQHELRSIAFCCISTGEFHFPSEKAVETALEAAARFIAERHSGIKIIFNVLKDEDYAIYTKLFKANQ